jgi:hypothetical protein
MGVHYMVKRTLFMKMAVNGLNNDKVKANFDLHDVQTLLKLVAILPLL